MILVWRSMLFMAVVGIVCSIFSYHLPPNGRKDIQYWFDGPTGSVSFVYPVSRVRDRERGDDRVSYIRMIEDPVYFDVTTSVPYDTATFDITYDNTTSIPLQIGMKQHDGVSPAILLKDFEKIVRRGIWSQGSVSFDLSKANRYNSKYTFAFSVPGLVTEKNRAGEIRLSEMTLHLKRKPLSWGNSIKHQIQNLK